MEPPSATPQMHPPPCISESPHTPPEHTKSSRVILATYNRQDGQNSHLTQLCRCLDLQNIDTCVTTETRIPAGHDSMGTHSQQVFGYSIFCSYTQAKNQGGITFLAQQEATNWTIESRYQHGPNCSAACYNLATRLPLSSAPISRCNTWRTSPS